MALATVLVSVTDKPYLRVMSIADLESHERPRERLLAMGADSLTERELLALVLRSGRQDEDAVGLAASLLAEYGGVRGLASALPEELVRRSGVGVAKSASIVAAFRLGRLVSTTHGVPMKLASGQDVATAARPHLDGARRERVVVLICDSSNRLRWVERVSEGSIDRSLVSVREVLNAVLRHDGRAFAVVHNHPSGDPTPSEADFETTKALRRGADLVGLRFLDHVVVANDEWRTVTGRR